MATYYHLAIRVDKLVDDFCAFLDRRVEPGFAVRETAESGEHVHAYVYSRVKPASYRVILKRELPGLAGNGAYSIAECRDVEKYHRYMCKGDVAGAGPEIVWCYGWEWTSDKFDELHFAYWEANNVKKIRRDVGVLDYVLDRCQEAGIAWDDRTAISEEYIKELVARSKPINLFSVKAAVNLIQVKLCPDDSAIRVLASQVLL